MSQLSYIVIFFQNSSNKNSKVLINIFKQIIVLSIEIKK